MFVWACGLDFCFSYFKLIYKCNSDCFIIFKKFRSLFVPYFKYLLESCVRYLSSDEGADLVGLKRKKKKAKINDMKIQEENDEVLAQKHWHLRTLIVETLHKCFLYDSDQKILDSSNFEVSLTSCCVYFIISSKFVLL